MAPKVEVQAMNRRSRRNAWRVKARYDRLDDAALIKIRRSLIYSEASYGGTRCPGCGISVRPHWVEPFTARIGGATILIHGQPNACDGAGAKFINCPGERSWHDQEDE